jgi:hypothetical protein
MLRFFHQIPFETLINRIYGLTRIQVLLKSAKSHNPINPRFHA